MKTDPINEGSEAYHDGADRDANPYPVDSAEYDAWELGWEEALEENDMCYECDQPMEDCQCSD